MYEHRYLLIFIIYQYDGFLFVILLWHTTYFVYSQSNSVFNLLKYTNWKNTIKNNFVAEFNDTSLIVH